MFIKSYSQYKNLPQNSNLSNQQLYNNWMLEVDSLMPIITEGVEADSSMAVVGVPSVGLGAGAAGYQRPVTASVAVTGSAPTGSAGGGGVIGGGGFGGGAIGGGMGPIIIGGAEGGMATPIIVAG